jgi:hypothetical protein
MGGHVGATPARLEVSNRTAAVTRAFPGWGGGP